MTLVTVAAPYPLLDAGEYVALCTEASVAWARQWASWKVRLMFEPRNYEGRSYVGRLCKFFDLGKNASSPYAGARSAFRTLWVEVNGEQPTSPKIDTSIFAGRLYYITVETVTKNRKGKSLDACHFYSIIREVRPLFEDSKAFAEPSNPSTLRASKPPNLRTIPTSKPENQTTVQPNNRPTELPSNRLNLPLARRARKSCGQQKKEVGQSNSEPSHDYPEDGADTDPVGPVWQDDSEL
jgi:hypothetical protein